LNRGGVRIERVETELLLANAPDNVARRGNPSWNRFIESRCANISDRSQRPRILPRASRRRAESRRDRRSRG